MDRFGEVPVMQIQELKYPYEPSYTCKGLINVQMATENTTRSGISHSYETGSALSKSIQNPNEF